MLHVTTYSFLRATDTRYSHRSNAYFYRATNVSSTLTSIKLSNTKNHRLNDLLKKIKILSIFLLNTSIVLIILFYFLASLYFRRLVQVTDLRSWMIYIYIYSISKFISFALIIIVLVNVASWRSLSGLCEIPRQCRDTGGNVVSSLITTSALMSN